MRHGARRKVRGGAGSLCCGLPKLGDPPQDSDRDGKQRWSRSYVPRYLAAPNKLELGTAPDVHTNLPGAYCILVSASIQRIAMT